MPQFPANLDIEGRRVLVVGGGRIALRKTEQLLACGADVIVVAPVIAADFDGLPVSRMNREFRAEDLNNVRLVITATNDVVVNQRVHDLCEERGIWINSADDPDRCTFTLPAVVRRGELMVTVSTAGASPALASHLRARISDALDPRWANVVDDLSTIRDRFHAEGTSTESIDWLPIISAVLAWHGVGAPTAQQLSEVIP